MQIEKFKSGSFINQSGFKAFTPSFINTSWKWTNRASYHTTVPVGQENS